jgi:hypothetical protein
MPPRYKPNVKQSSEEFYSLAMQPEYPDEIALQIDRDRSGEGREVGYSQEAVDEIAEQFRMFLLARTYAHYKGSGFMPKHIRATVTLDFNPPTGDPVDDPTVGPFYQINDDRGPTPIDGTRRTYTWRNS